MSSLIVQFFCSSGLFTDTLFELSFTNSRQTVLNSHNDGIIGDQPKVVFCWIISGIIQEKKWLHPPPKPCTHTHISPPVQVVSVANYVKTTFFIGLLLSPCTAFTQSHTIDPSFLNKNLTGPDTNNGGSSRTGYPKFSSEKLPLLSFQILANLSGYGCICSSLSTRGIAKVELITVSPY